MGLFEKFFGVIAAPTGTPILSSIYAVIGGIFTVLCFGRWIMPHAALDLTLPWAIVSLLLFITGVYGYWGTTKGSIWHKRQFVSASWGFLLMLLCWAIVYIAVENNHIEKVNNDCMERNPDWNDYKCEESRASTVTIATVLVSVGLVFGIYFTLVVSRWVSGLEWEAHLEKEERLEKRRRGQIDNPQDTIIHGL
ncbi:hypothetical protein FBU30_005353 [Linnemannia zychae]|nr:hypothetical protein FBU30_005353 [Linnemannia zychae]